MLETIIAALFISAVLLLFIGLWNRWRQNGQQSQSYSANFGGDYFRGLNYLLNEQPDKALEVFLHLAEVNPDTVETHLALGNLFRRRGEVEHAIRCHENIIAKDSISAAERSHALLELAEDYRRAGLLDRAEDLYHQLAEHPDGRVLALKRLLEIYQQEQDWPQAIRIAERLVQAGQHHLHPLIAHFHCESVSQALAEQDLPAARGALAQAREHHSESLRCRLLDAELLLQAGEPRRAIEALRQPLRQQPELLPVALSTLTQAYCAAGATHELRAELSDWLGQRQDTSATMALFQLYQASGEQHAARQLLLQQLEQRSNVRLLRTLLTEMSASEFQQQSDRLRPIVEQLCQDLLDSEVSYRCRHCGYGGHSHHWQCPSCKQWDSTWPIRGVTGE